MTWLDDLKNQVTPSAAREALSPAFSTLAASFFSRPVIPITAIYLVFYYAKWKSFLDQYRLKHFITYSDMDLQSIPRNILFKAAGTQSWYYMDSANFPCLIASPDRPLHRMIHQRSCYLLYDHFVSWTEEVSRFFLRQRCRFGEIATAGCLWAEHLREFASRGPSDSLRETLAPHRETGRKLVAVFDSTYHDDSLTTYEDGLAYLKGLHELLEKMPGITVILKEKKSRRHPWASRFETLYDKFQKHPRAIMLPRTQSPSELMAAADLVISFPYTSTTFEALSARRKAIYFDPAEKFRETYFDRIPGLVCHNVGELASRVKELLFQTTPEDWNRYVDTHLKRAIEPYCDGKALTRFRKALRGHFSTPVRPEEPHALMAS